MASVDGMTSAKEASREDMKPDVAVSPSSTGREQQAVQRQAWQPVRRFALPVDTEHKAKSIAIFSLARPHMRSFHLNWLGFCVTFFSAYASAPLIPVIRDSLNLSQIEINLAGTAHLPLCVLTTMGAVFAPIFMGAMCDRFGPRYAYAGLLMTTSCFVFGMALTFNATGYIIMRVLIGFALSAFVICQFWSSMMFSPNVVGIANALAGGWGNAGGGVTQLVMPYLTVGIGNLVPRTIAWRWAFFFPGCMHIIIASLIMLFTQDLPDGNYHHLERTGKKNKASPLRELLMGARNYRTLGCAACYAFSFGVELALDNAMAPYFEKNFEFSITKAGNLAAIFGTLNFVSRPLGGAASDYFGRMYGMRGRIWVLWTCISLGGVFTAAMGALHYSLAGTLVAMVLSASFIEATCGAVYAVVPFISRRSTGIVCGLVSAGGNFGGVLNQAIWFLNTPTKGLYYINQYEAFQWLGCAMIGMATIGVAPIYFPQWGGMLCGPRKFYTEEMYYYSEYSPAERDRGMHLLASNFAFESRSMRGMKRLAADAMYPAVGKPVPARPSRPPSEFSASEKGLSAEDV